MIFNSSRYKNQLIMFGCVFAMLFLNAALSFDNWWPTPGIELDKRIAPEFIYFWALMLLWVGWKAGISPRALRGFSVVYLVLVIGRYADLTVPALFGRNINLYWDMQQIPRLLFTTGKNYHPLVLAAAIIAIAALIWALYTCIRLSISFLAKYAAPWALQRSSIKALSAVAVSIAVANLLGARATWPYISKPVLPVIVHQAKVLSLALLPGSLHRTLPDSPEFKSNFATLGTADIKLFMLESYGAVVFEDPVAITELQTSKINFSEAIERSGKQLVSAYIRSPTFAGGSELAHLSLLSGIDLSDPLRHDLLLTTKRPTLMTFLRSKGYQSFGLYSAMSWDWEEKSFYQFDQYVDARDLKYPGPKFGYWSIPDQYAIARFEAMNPANSPSSAGQNNERQKRFLFFPTISTHIPFSPTPPYQPDWQKLLSDQPYEPSLASTALQEEPNWLALFPRYMRTIQYNYEWLGEYIKRGGTANDVLILIGDHQPASTVSGRSKYALQKATQSSAREIEPAELSWDVPIHIISSNAKLIDRFVQLGFTKGLIPQQPRLAAMHELAPILLKAFGDE